ncbi:unnamed protein product [Prorocentrum cordatum]|uniref:Uncharacterized protein n=1 Tax=Prorocentrum cordatum TaxID=2364126 RepID=A0ABN9TB18_9DINO|nr:unnamed protein product [Polarella glacialis]|mmetsp:Transcript_96555/g.262285  ORF Transcript_96555/g.262285 Transcript_96555/m.262285 type:complete len:181 (+) Transcript_96555:121-663(+)
MPLQLAFQEAEALDHPAAGDADVGIAVHPPHAHGKKTSSFFNPFAKLGPSGTAGLGAAAGAGVGGQVMFRMCIKKCKAPPACIGVKNCVISCGNKSHMVGAAAAGAGSLLGNFAGKKAQGGDMGLDEYTAGPIFAQWKRVEDEERRSRTARGADRFSDFCKFLCVDDEGRRSGEEATMLA